jgi:hypothetical protein
MRFYSSAWAAEACGLAMLFSADPMTAWQDAHISDVPPSENPPDAMLNG